MAEARAAGTAQRSHCPHRLVIAPMMAAVLLLGACTASQHRQVYDRNTTGHILYVYVTRAFSTQFRTSSCFLVGFVQLTGIERSLVHTLWRLLVQDQSNHSRGSPHSDFQSKQRAM